MNGDGRAQHHLTGAIPAYIISAWQLFTDYELHMAASSATADNGKPAK